MYAVLKWCTLMELGLLPSEHIGIDASSLGGEEILSYKN